jgi:hypothetical protein
MGRDGNSAFENPFVCCWPGGLFSSPLSRAPVAAIPLPPHPAVLLGLSSTYRTACHRHDHRCSGPYHCRPYPCFFFSSLPGLICGGNFAAGAFKEDSCGRGTNCFVHRCVNLRLIILEFLAFLQSKCLLP